MHSSSRFLLLIPVLIVSPLSSALNLENGKKLHTTECKSCHVGMSGGEGTLIYTRKNRRVNSLTDLENQVRRCESNLELKWFEDDISDVVYYLNTHFYKFSQTQESKP